MAAAFLLVGCASAASDNPFSGDWNRGVLTLFVDSRHDYNVDLYISPSGRRQRLGTVRANTQEFFRFEYPTDRPLMIELESELGEHYRVPAAVFTGGGRVDLRIQRNLRDSQYIRRAPQNPESWRPESRHPQE
jgi:hypothetical protein